MGKCVRKLACLVLISACQSRPAGELPVSSAAADSLVLDRSRCFGSCPAYRLSLRADGRVTFTAMAPGGLNPVRTDSIAPSQFAWLLQQGQRIGLASFPSVIAEDKSLCRVRATDHASATVTIFWPDSTRQVIDYLGCYGGVDLTVAAPLAQLRRFETQIDSVAQSERWTRSATRH